MQWIEVLDKFGLPIFLLLIILYAVNKTGKYLGERLFSQEKGLVTKITDQHITFLKDTSENVKTQTEIGREINTQLKLLQSEIISLFEKHRHDLESYSIVRTNAGLALMAKAAKVACEQFGAKDLKDIFDKAEIVLTQDVIHKL